MIYDDLADLTEKGERRAELNAMFRQKAREITVTEQAIKDEMKETKERLEILQVIKMRERKKSRIEQERLRAEHERLAKELYALRRRMGELEAQLEAIR